MNKTEIILAAIKENFGSSFNCFDIVPNEVINDDDDVFDQFFNFTPRQIENDNGDVVSGKTQTLEFAVIDDEPLLIVGEGDEFEITPGNIYGQLYWGQVLVDKGEQTQVVDSAVAAIQFALSLGIEGIDFLRMWNQGDFPEIREDWPECPDEVFIGADPLFKQRKS